MRVCLTGGTGFVGSALVSRLIDRGAQVSSLTRAGSNRPHQDAVDWMVWNGDDPQSLEPALKTTEVIIHLAGRAHVLAKPTPDSDRALREANVRYTERMARAAVNAGVRRIVYVSSLAVYGSSLGDDDAIAESTKTDPLDAYGQTKLEAEQILQGLASRTSMELVIVRPALVVGPSAPGNLARLARLVRRGVPIPVPFQDNQRSFVTLSNLVTLLITCAQSDKAVGQVFVAAEHDWPSTKAVLNWIGQGMGRQVRTVGVPAIFLRGALSLIGKASLYDKVFGDLKVDSTKARELLGWEPGQTLEEAFRQLGSSHAR